MSDEQDDPGSPGGPGGPGGADADEPAEDAVLEAATDLFASKGLIVTFLWLQKETGVPADQLTARFGSIDGLLTATLNYQLTRLTYQMRGRQFDPAAFAEPGIRRFWHVVTHAVLAGRDVAALQGRFPAVEGHARRLLHDPATDSKEAAYIAAAEATCLMVGWVLMEDFFVAAGRLDDVPLDLVRADVMTTVRQVGTWRSRQPGLGPLHEVASPEPEPEPEPGLEPEPEPEPAPDPEPPGR